MAQSYTRRINLYINGKEVTNDVASIRAEMNKLINAQARMTIGSKEYLAQTAKIRSLKAILDQHRADLAGVERGWSMKKIGDVFNRYQALAMGVIATLTGLVFAVRGTVKAFMDFESRLANLSALTGLSGDNLKWLGDKAKEFSTTILDGGIRLTKNASEIVDAFTLMGSARPELLKDKEALAEVTKSALILAQAARIETTPAVEAVAAAMNQFGMKSFESTRIINAFSAGALQGSALVPQLTESLAKCGTVANNSNLTLEETIGVLETLGEHQLKGAEAGTQFKTSLVSLKAANLGYVSGAFNMRDAIVELKSKMDAKNTAMEKDNLLISIFGKRNLSVGTILTSNIARYDYFTQALTGTNVAMQQASINSDTHAAKLAQAVNRLNLMAIDLGEKLAPALVISTSGFSYFVKIVSAGIDFFIKYKATIVTTTASIIAYTTWIKIEAIWEARKNKEKLTSIILGKLQDLAYRAQFAGIALYNAGLALLKGNLALASLQFRIFSGALMANPIGLVITAITALTVGLYMYSGQLTAAQKAQLLLNDINLEAQKNIVEEKVKIETLLSLAKNEKLSKQERLDAIRELNAISPKYLGSLTLENISTKKAAEAVKEYTESLLENARVQAAKEKLVEIEKELLDLNSGKGADLTYWQKAKNAVLSLGNVSANYSLNAMSAAQNLSDRQKELNLQKEKLITITQSQATANMLLSHSKEDKLPDQDLIKQKEEELAAIKAEIAVTPEEVASRNARAEAVQNEIDKLNSLGTSREGREDDKQVKKRIEQIEAANSKEIASIKKRHAEGLTSDAQYDADLLDQEIKFLDQKAKAYKNGSKEYEEAYALSEAKKLEATEKVHKLLEEAEKELANAKVSNLKEGIDKQKAIEEERWKEELEALQKKLIVKKDLNEKEIKLNETTNGIIAEKKTEHEKTMSDLDKATIQKKEMDDALMAEANAKTQEEGFQAQRDLARANYDQDVIDADGNAVKLAQAQKKLSDNLIKIKTDELSARQEIGDAMFNSAQTLFGGLAELVGKETALGKALFLFQQAAAIGQVVFNTAIANAKAVAAFPWTGGMPWVAINTASAVGSIASIVAQTIAGFSEGGYTGDGEKYQVAGTVHKGEYVIPAGMLKNPQIASLVAGLEQMRQGRYTISPQAFQITQKRGFATGGYSSQNQLPSKIKIKNQKSEGSMSEDTALALIESINKLNSWKPEISIATYERKKENWQKTTTSGLS